MLRLPRSRAGRARGNTVWSPRHGEKEIPEFDDPGKGDSDCPETIGSLHRSQSFPFLPTRLDSLKENRIRNDSAEQGAEFSYPCTRRSFLKSKLGKLGISVIGDPVHGDEEGFGIMKSRGRTIFEAPASLPRNTIDRVLGF